ncbi:MAG: hypothetical protein MUC97_04280 [Bernardetiaceae bacterium]|jgi:hypothetical protein|nr:hypothetical protein [Bernardetiaceae bacterium]
MGFLPIFLFLGIGLSLWLLTVRESLAAKKRQVEALANALAAEPSAQRTEAYQRAVRHYNYAIGTAPARLPARLFGFRPIA